MTTPSEEEPRLKLRKYNWSGDRDYQLAVIAFREVLAAHTKTIRQQVIAEVRGKMPERNHIIFTTPNIQISGSDTTGAMIQTWNEALNQINKTLDEMEAL